eukprot:766705-Hanusia_phi.AAC.1
MATSETSGMSRPSRRRLTPTRMSNFPARRPWTILSLSMDLTSECSHADLRSWSLKKADTSSAVLLVRVVISTLSFLEIRSKISLRRSST